MVNSLTRQAGLKLGPILLETLVKHYFERLSKDHESNGDSTGLRREELLYDEAFNVIKSFMEAATKHTIEELQAFSNTRTPSPPWVHTVRLLVPMSCCDDAAVHLIQALGGEEVTKRVVGGTKWWQVRGLKGIDAEWIVAKKDWQEAKRKQKARDMSMDGTPIDNGNPNQEMPPEYQPEMDEMRCILYAHGGGYYFGSFDQERYTIQRLARKINGRVFAINYRLAPQYPFPCAIQDLIAAYLYLIRPPPGAPHTPLSPSNIVFSGDSAGGGLCIAALQVVRDSGLPTPGGAVLISPWCDLTHSFPSIHLNTATDIIPPYGLSFYKPSTLWPPPPDEVTLRVHQRLRERIREAVWPKAKESTSTLQVPESDPAHPGGLPSRSTTPDYSVPDPSSGRTLHLGAMGSVPALDGTNSIRSQRLSVQTPKGETLAIDAQVHMYAPNYLLTHPLVSPVVSYLGGLPPLLFIASDKEVLRDEVIYCAHKAAHPDQYPPIHPEVKLLYPALEGIEQRYGPTKVHLQVYDDCAHVLPVLFAFTTPGKYCFRAMATFVKYVTGLLPKPDNEMPMIFEDMVTMSPSSTQSNLANLTRLVGGDQRGQQKSSTLRPRFMASQSEPSMAGHADVESNLPLPPASTTAASQFSTQSGASRASSIGKRQSVRLALNEGVMRASDFLRRHNTVSGGRPGSSSSSSAPEHERESTSSSDVGGPRWNRKSTGHPEHRHAGERSVYDNGLDTMIRERISTHGVVRPLEAESKLTAFLLPPELIGQISELAARRYIEGVAKFGKKFSKTAKAIEKERRKNLERAKRDTTQHMTRLHTYLMTEREAVGKDPAEKKESLLHKMVHANTAQGAEGLAASGSWQWAWALDMDENPPPSSIVSRRDTDEARRLAKIADQAVLTDENAMSANNLWSLIVNFLTATPERDDGHKHKHRHGHRYGHERKGSEASSEDWHGDGDSGAVEKETSKNTGTSRRERIVSKFAWLVAEHRKSQRGGATSKVHGEK